MAAALSRDASAAGGGSNRGATSDPAEARETCDLARANSRSEGSIAADDGYGVDLDKLEW